MAARGRFLRALRAGRGAGGAASGTHCVRQRAGVARHGRPTTPGPRLEFSRFASAEGIDTPRRIAYALNGKQQIELWLWPALDAAPGALPARYPVLSGVTAFEIDYLDAALVWTSAWPTSPRDAAIPRAVRLRIMLASGEEIVRVFALDS